MTWTYNDAPAYNPDGTYNLDLVRLMLGDFDTTNQLLSDEKLNFFISEETDPLIAAARGAESLAAQYSGRSMLHVGDMSIRYDQICKQWEDRATYLRDRAYRSIGIFVGGLNVPMEEAKPDHLRKFWRDMHLDKTY